MESNQAETERQIREKLEASGQFGKMRAMIVDAALQALTNGTSASSQEAATVFLPKDTLTSLKATDEGVLALSIVAEFLDYLGLKYTASVFKMESGAVKLEDSQAISLALPRSSGTSSGSPAALLTLLRAAAGAGSGASPPSSAPIGSNDTWVSVPVPIAVDVMSKDNTLRSATTSGSSSDSDAEGVEEEVEKKDEAKGETQEYDDGPAGEDTTYYISKWRRRTFVRDGEVTGQQVQVEYLTDCKVVILDPLDSMTVDDCEGGELIIAACEGSVFLRNCKNMTVHVACKQLRTRDCENIDLHIFTTTDPVVEMSHHMSFRPFHMRLPRLCQSFKDCRLDPSLNRFVHVYDFTVDAPGLPQPHFSVHFPEHGVAMEDRYGDRGTPECPREVGDLVALRLMPAASSESGQNKSYDIKTGAQMWAAAQGGHESDDEGVHEEDGSTSESSKEMPPVPVVVPTVGGGKRPPIAPVPTAVPAPTPAGGLDDQGYSSFDDSEDGQDSNDKYNVDEDDDDF